MVLMSLVKSFAGLIVARVFLGMMESGYFPGVAFYLTNFYKRDELAFRIAIFFSMATLAGAFGGILAYGIGFIKNVGMFKNSWHWIFIIGTHFSLYKLANFRRCFDGNCQSTCPSFHSRCIYPPPNEIV
jgi:MFS family permease